MLISFIDNRISSVSKRIEIILVNMIILSRLGLSVINND